MTGITRKKNLPPLLPLILFSALAFASGFWSGLPERARHEGPDVPVPHELPVGVLRWHDADMGVTCWTYENAQGMACLPDPALAPYQAAEAERYAGTAVIAR